MDNPDHRLWSLVLGHLSYRKRGYVGEREERILWSRATAHQCLMGREAFLEEGYEPVGLKSAFGCQVTQWSLLMQTLKSQQSEDNAECLH